jgi:hypothetical protein
MNLPIKPLYTITELCQLFQKNKQNSLYKYLKNNNIEIVVIGNTACVTAESLQQNFPSIWRSLLIVNTAECVLEKLVSSLLEDEALTKEIKARTLADIQTAK